MEIRVQGTNLDIPSQVREEAVSKFSKVRQIWDQFIDMDITFTEETNPRISDKIHCEVALHAKGRSLRATAAAPDPLSAIDRAEDKLSRQVRKLKTKLIDGNRQPAPPPTDGRLTPTDAVDVPPDLAGGPTPTRTDQA